MVNAISLGLWTVWIILKWKVESYTLIIWIIYSGYDNRTRQTEQVIRDLYSPNNFYIRLGEWASANFHP